TLPVDPASYGVSASPQAMNQLLNDLYQHISAQVIDDITRQVSANVAQEVTEKVTRDVTEKVTLDVTEKVTQEVTALECEWSSSFATPPKLPPNALRKS